MANYVLVYKGGSVPQGEEEQQRVMAAWGGWFGGLGAAVVDAGNPFAGSKSVGSDGSVSDGGSARLTGYSVLAADSLDAATGMAQGCPILASGGTVEVYETLVM